MKINKDYRVKLNAFNILNDSRMFWVESARQGKKVPCADIVNNKVYEVESGEYLVEIQEAILIIHEDILKMKRRAVFIKTLKSLLPW